MTKHDEFIDGRDTGFLHSLNRCHLSAKQLADRIIAKVRAYGGGRC